MSDADRTDAVDPDPVDTSVDDWAPLPEEKRLLHPGELVESEPQPQAAPHQAASHVGHAPSTPSWNAQPAVVAEPDPADDPAAEQAMADLEARIAATAPATSLVAEIVHREERKERQQRAASAVRAADAAIMQGGRQPRDPLPIEYDAGVHGRDPREEEAWFRALPAEERQRLQAAWAEKRQLSVVSGATERRNGNRRLVAALIVFATVIITGTGSQWAATAGAGVCCGLWWRHTRPDRFFDPLRALGCFIGLHLTAWAAHGDISPVLFMDAVLLIGFATIVGFDGEIRRTGGFDSRGPATAR